MTRPGISGDSLALIWGWRPWVDIQKDVTNPWGDPGTIFFNWGMFQTYVSLPQGIPRNGKQPWKDHSYDNLLQGTRLWLTVIVQQYGIHQIICLISPWDARTGAFPERCESAWTGSELSFGRVGNDRTETVEKGSWFHSYGGSGSHGGSPIINMVVSSH